MALLVRLLGKSFSNKNSKDLYMETYQLYLESGPRMKTTMVHVPALLGCIARGATTEEALQNTPDAIKAFLTYLESYREEVKPDAEINLVIAAHVMEGPWIGYGDPAPGFKFDFEPLTPNDHKLYLHRLTNLQSDLVSITKAFPISALTENPLNGHRSIFDILAHIVESQAVYLRYLTGPVDGLTPALKTIHPDNEFLQKLVYVFNLIDARLSELTTAEFVQLVPHGQVTWSARRCFRRTLEHSWEHLCEIHERISTK
jgi:predicted RNase H-like HicB family nuclease